MKAVRKVCIGDFLNKSQNWVEPKPDETYKQITARLWGKGLTLRAEVAGSQIAAARQLRVKAGQFLVSRIDARHGAFGIVPPSLDGALVSNDFPCFDIDSKVVLPTYFAWYARTESFIALCRRASEGSTNRVRLKENEFLRMTVPLPPLDEQRRIVAKLDKVTELVEEAKATGENIHREVQALLRALVRGAPEQPHPTVPFGEVALQRPVDIEVEPDAEYQFAGVYSFGRGVFRSEVKVGAEFGYKKLTRLDRNDFTYPKLMAWEGALGVVPEECAGCYVSPEFPVFQINQEILHPAVVDAYFKDPLVWPSLVGTSKGTNARRRRLHPDTIRSHRIPVPPRNVQQIIRDIVERLAPYSVRKEPSELDTLIPALMHRVFNVEATASRCTEPRR